VTTPGGVSPQTTAAWDRYLAEEHQAREQYLMITEVAHRSYLTGPWPDRETYTTVERQAWGAYYAAGRKAWQDYRRDLATETPPPPPGPAATYPYQDSYRPNLPAGGGLVDPDSNPYLKRNQ
jgi:hypothetical protein